MVQHNLGRKKLSLSVLGVDDGSLLHGNVSSSAVIANGSGLLGALELGSSGDGKSLSKGCSLCSESSHSNGMSSTLSSEEGPSASDGGSSTPSGEESSSASESSLPSSAGSESSSSASTGNSQISESAEVSLSS